MPASDRALTLTRIAAAAASDRLAQDIVALDVSEHLVITDTFLICSAPSDRQVRAIVDAVEERMREQADTRPVRREGDREARWVLLDYVDIVVHVQHTEEREFYSLERLWKDCPAIPLEDVTGEAAESRRVQVPIGWDPGLAGPGYLDDEDRDDEDTDDEDPADVDSADVDSADEDTDDEDPADEDTDDEDPGDATSRDGSSARDLAPDPA